MYVVLSSRHAHNRRWLHVETSTSLARSPHCATCIQLVTSGVCMHCCTAALLLSRRCEGFTGSFSACPSFLGGCQKIRRVVCALCLFFRAGASQTAVNCTVRTHLPSPPQKTQQQHAMCCVLPQRSAFAHRGWQCSTSRVLCTRVLCTRENEATDCCPERQYGRDVFTIDDRQETKQGLKTLLFFTNEFEVCPQEGTKNEPFVTLALQIVGHTKHKTPSQDAK